MPSFNVSVNDCYPMTYLHEFFVILFSFVLCIFSSFLGSFVFSFLFVIFMMVLCDGGGRC